MTKDEYIKKVEDYCEAYANAKLFVKEVNDYNDERDEEGSYHDYILSMSAKDEMTERKEDLISFLYSSTYEDVEIKK